MDRPNTISRASAMRRIQERIPDFVSLMRINKPIGTFLLLWPTLSALWVASEGQPDYLLLIVFTGGVALMRAAGCVINDFADQHWDGQVSRTQNRPMALKRVRSHEALLLFSLLCFSAFGLVCLTNLLTIKLSIIAVVLATIYPFSKRFTYFPQVFLGAAFSFGIPMAFSAVQNTVPSQAWLLFTFNCVWTVAYDTQYALVDREDDIEAGIKSTAIFFGPYALPAIASLQAASLIPLVLMGVHLKIAFPFFISLAAMVCLFINQYRLTLYLEPEACFRAFLNNAWVGVVLFTGIFISYHPSIL